MNTLRLLLATCACALAFAADRKPNILVIVSDDHGYADVGFNGWVSAEVEGGDVARLKIVLEQMKTALLG